MKRAQCPYWVGYRMSKVTKSMCKSLRIKNNGGSTVEKRKGSAALKWRFNGTRCIVISSQHSPFKGLAWEYQPVHDRNPFGEGVHKGCLQILLLCSKTTRAIALSSNPHGNRLTCWNRLVRGLFSGIWTTVGCTKVQLRTLESTTQDVRIFIRLKRTALKRCPAKL